MNEISAPSPNHDARDARVDMIVLHYTGMKTGDEALARLRDPETRVSAHVVIETDGRIFRLVGDDRRAWHAGIAEWRGRADVNARSIGVEIVNPGHEWGYRNFPPAQIEAVCAVVAAARARHAVPLTGIVGHADVAPHRKDDPGERFPWAMLAARDLALPPWDRTLPKAVPEGADALAALAAIGYPVASFGNAASTLAFQRRFAPSEIGGGLSPATRAAIGWVAARPELSGI